MQEKLIKKADPREVSEIVLGKNRYVDSLYGCFRFNNPKGEPFAAERQVEIVMRSGRKVAVRVPPDMRIDLPPDVKLVNSPAFRIEPIGKNRDTMHLLTMRVGWNQTDCDINRMVGMDPRGTFAARVSGEGFDLPVATASVLPLGRDNTWIGMILVHPELRRQGIANCMMQHCVKYAIDSGKIINGLDATPMGNTVYGAVGYVNSFRVWRSVFELKEFEGRAYDQNRIKPMQAGDLGDVIRYDASSWIEREEIIRGLFRDGGDEGCFVYRDDSGVVRGFCMTRPGRIRPFVGPFIADTDEIASGLLAAAARRLLKAGGAANAFIDTPEIHFADRGVYAERVFEQAQKPSGHKLSKSLACVRDFTRMYQLVRHDGVDRLVRDFMRTENLAGDAPRVKAFRETMEKSTLNYSRTLAFMNLERDVLQKKIYGSTGPEKG